MTFLPIVARELRVASRRAGTYWIRCGAALTLIVIGAWFFLMMASQSPKETSIFLFRTLAALAIFHCLLRGFWSTADCLSEEKREGTLGLLFLTDLKGYDVVLGKLAASSLNAFYALLAVLPIMAIPLLMGGVAPGEYGRMALVAVVTLFYSLSIGLCASAFTRSLQRSTAISFAAIFLLTAGLPALAAWYAAYKQLPGIPTGLLLASPGFSYYLAVDSVYVLRPQDFFLSLGVIHGLSWCCLIIACVQAPRSWQEKPPGALKVRWSERARAFSLGERTERLAYRRRLLSHNAYYWLAARVRTKPLYLWSVLGLVACGWAWGIAKFHRDWFSLGIYLSTALFFNLLFKIWFAQEAVQQISEDRRHGGLELLLSTPLSVRDILHGQFLALRRQFLGPLLVVLTACFLFMFGETSEMMSAEDRHWWVLFWCALMVMLVADLAALYWVGMWQGLTASNPARAASKTASLVLILPWIGVALVGLVAALVSISQERDPGESFFLGLWFVLGLANDAIFAGWARHRLLKDFRDVAARRYSKRAGWLKRLFGGGSASPTGG
jgi:ABC-type Na+ efflux pump permease subunit